jgi:hypothetical protein
MKLRVIGGPRTRGALLFLAILATASAVGVWKGSTVPSAAFGASSCADASSFSVASGAARAHVSRVGTRIDLVDARRDSSATIVTLCLDGAMPDRAPVVVDGSRRLQPGGMRLVEQGHMTRAVLVYPPTAALAISVSLPTGSVERTIGTAAFAQRSAAGCSLRAVPPFSVRGCGTLLYLGWRSPWHIAPARFGIMDVRPFVRTRTGWRRLEFYLYRVTMQAGRTEVYFAIPRTGARLLRLDTSEIELVRPPSVLRPRSRVFLRLVPGRPAGR